MKKLKKLPDFKTNEEFGRFFETHSPLDYLHEFKFERVDAGMALAPELAEKIRLRAKKRLLALRLPEYQIAQAKKVAKKRKVPYQALMRRWIGDGLARELKNPGCTPAY